jgi:hypothetical protein
MKMKKMTRAIILFLCLLTSGVAARSPGQEWKDDESFKTFWEKFRAAVIRSDKEAVVGLSNFPIRMPGRVVAIGTPADLRVRYKEVFNKRTDAAKCFARDDSSPVAQNEGSRQTEYAVFCDLKTGDVAVYSLKLTKAGWKFVRFSQQQQLD